ncbi:MAG TPA: glycosyltransferase [Gaiellaceae bacterium]|nr:glycosyltransferase [Gaiellaceae bacterium]
MRGDIRVLRVIARLNVGGPALHVAYLTHGLAERGYDTTLVTGTVGEGEGSMEYVARDFGVEPVFIPELQRDISARSDARVVQRLRDLIVELRPDVLHTHTAKAGAVGRVAAAMAGRARPKLVVHTFHGHVLRGYFAPAVGSVFRALERGLGMTTDVLVAVSPEVRDDLVRLGVADRSQIAVVRLGLDLDARVATTPDARAEVRAALGVPEERFLVGWLGRVTEIKRVDDLLRSFAHLRHSGADAALAIVGDGPQLGDAQRLAAALGVADRCHFLGYQRDVARFLAAFDTVALTSANEGTPVTLIEAQAAGVPVVSTDVGGVADVVADGVTGFLTDVSDTRAFADRLAALAADEDVRRSFGAAGRQRVVSRYGVDRLLDDVDDLYRTLLDAKEPRVGRTLDGRARTLPRALPPRAGAWVRPPRDRLRVILLSQYFPPEVGATQSRMQSFAEHLADRGHRVCVICEFPNHPHGVIPPEYKGMLVEDDLSNAYRVLRVWVRAEQRKTQSTRMAFYLSYMALATAASARAGPADVIVATTPPLFTAVAGAAIARMKRAPLVLDVRDLWPAAAVSLNQIGPTAARAGAWLERTLYSEAAATVAVTKPFCNHIDGFRRKPPPTALIPNGTLEMFFDLEPAERRALTPNRDRFVVTFAGTHGIAQGLPSVLDAAERVDSGADFVFIGEGPVREALVADSAARGLANVHFRPQVPLHDMPPLVAASDALLVPLSAHPTFETFVPSKLIDFMAVGRPVILAAAGEAARLVTTAGAGVVVEPENPAALADAVRWLREHPAEAAAMGARGREFARKRLRSVQAERLEELLLSLCRDRG